MKIRISLQDATPEEIAKYLEYIAEQLRQGFISGYGWRTCNDDQSLY